MRRWLEERREGPTSISVGDFETGEPWKLLLIFPICGIYTEVVLTVLKKPYVSLTGPSINGGFELYLQYSLMNIF
jgi:hypothetical protein